MGRSDDSVNAGWDRETGEYSSTPIAHTMSPKEGAREYRCGGCELPYTTVAFGPDSAVCPRCNPGRTRNLPVEGAREPEIEQFEKVAVLMVQDGEYQEPEPFIRKSRYDALFSYAKSMLAEHEQIMSERDDFSERAEKEREDALNAKELAESKLASLSALARGEDPALEMELRQLMWLSHGHLGLYGDDGEMQCGSCSKYGCWDYRNGPLDEVRKAYQAACHERMAKHLNPPPSTREEPALFASLEAAANAATQGEWFHRVNARTNSITTTDPLTASITPNGEAIALVQMQNPKSFNNAAYIAAANPKAILELIRLARTPPVERG